MSAREAVIASHALTIFTAKAAAMHFAPAERGELAYEAGQLHLLLDEAGVPREDADGRRYPLAGRVAWLVLPLLRRAWDRDADMLPGPPLGPEPCPDVRR